MHLDLSFAFTTKISLLSQYLINNFFYNYQLIIFLIYFITYKQHLSIFLIIKFMIPKNAFITQSLILLHIHQRAIDCYTTQFQGNNHVILKKKKKTNQNKSSIVLQILNFLPCMQTNYTYIVIFLYGKYFVNKQERLAPHISFFSDNLKIYYQVIERFLMITKQNEQKQQNK